jgi:hypothetical protein
MRSVVEGGMRSPINFEGAKSHLSDSATAGGSNYFK